jgi:hypothetical protein
MNVGDLKELLNGQNDDLIVIFEHQEKGEPDDTSYAIDKIESRNSFCMLISVD